MTENVTKRGLRQNEVFGNPIILNDTPAKSSLKANTWGIYNDELYVKFGNNKMYKFTGTEITE